MSSREDKYNGHFGLIWFLFCLLIGLVILYFYVREDEQPKPRHIDEEIVVETVPTVEEDDNSCMSLISRPDDKECICPH